MNFYQSHMSIPYGPYNMGHIKSKWIIKYEIESKYEFHVDKRDFQQILIQRFEKQLCEPEINFEKW